VLFARLVPIGHYDVRAGHNIVSPIMTEKNWDRLFWPRLRSIPVCVLRIYEGSGWEADTGSVKDTGVNRPKLTYARIEAVGHPAVRGNFALDVTLKSAGHKRC
jgi:hypothetical protein